MSRTAIPILCILFLGCGTKRPPQRAATPENPHPVEIQSLDGDTDTTPTGAENETTTTASSTPLSETEADGPRCPAPQYRLNFAEDLVDIQPVDGAPGLESDDGARRTYHGDLNGDGQRDVILNLGGCGNWGECLHAVLLACEDNLFSLASEPDYVLSFDVETQNGTPVLWEMTRGGSVGNDDEGRVRWELDNCPFHRTDEYELIRLNRDFPEPGPQEFRHLTSNETLTAFCNAHRCFGDESPKAYIASDIGRMGIVFAGSKSLHIVEETILYSPRHIKPRWVSVRYLPNKPGIYRIMEIDVLSSRGGPARRITAEVGSLINKWWVQVDPGSSDGEQTN